MTTVKEHIQDLKELNETFSNIADSLKEIIVNPAYTLEQRWTVFLEGQWLLEDHYYTPRSMDILSDAMYDDFYMERRETKSFSDIDDQITESYDPEDEDSENYNRMYGKRDEWREAVLKEGYKGFTYDW